MPRKMSGALVPVTAEDDGHAHTAHPDEGDQCHEQAHAGAEDERNQHLFAVGACAALLRLANAWRIV